MFIPIPTNKQFQDLTDKTFGRLSVKGYIGKKKDHGYWLCQCICGVTKEVRGAHLVAGRTMSCGCYQAEASKEYHTEHNMSHTPEHNAWSAMQSRCYNPNNIRYNRYGGRGIKVDPRWHTFEQFYADMGPRPSEQHSVDRKNNDEDYSPENCHWATNEQQAYNKSNTKRFELNGKLVTIADLAKLTTLAGPVIRERIRRGWSIEEAIGLASR